MSRPRAVLQAIQEQHEGGMPFERFMQEALYNPDFGYYTKTIRTVGRSGDFSTFATLGDSLAIFIAHWISQHPIRDIIEIGPGNGALAEKILKRLGWWRRIGRRYHLVDVDGPLRVEQDKRLRKFRIHRHAGMREALRATHGRSLIFSNELPDAFPCRVFEKTKTGWSEVWVRFGNETVEEFLKNVSMPNSEAFQHPLPVGQRVEIHESYHHWLESWASEWRTGTMLTIDYGDILPDLYHRRPLGTLRGYAHHQKLEGPSIYQAPGQIDLTADVNFSDLETWGKSLGWQTLRNRTLDQMLPANSDWQTREAAKAFRALEQRVS